MELNVGDIIYCLSYGKVVEIHTIERLTKKQAISNNVKFRREYKEANWIDVIGRSQYSTNIYKLESPELKQQRRRQYIINRLKHYKYENLNDEELEKINDIFDSFGS
jgi:predicted transcriptional regulator